MRLSNVQEGNPITPAEEENGWPGGAQQMFREVGRPQTGALLLQIRATEKSLQTEEEKKSAKEAFLPKIITQDIWNFYGSATNNVAKDFNRAYRDIIVDE